MNFRPFERPRGVRTVGVRKIVSFVKGLSPRFGPDLILRGRREKTDLTKVGRTFRRQAALPWWRPVAWRKSEPQIPVSAGTTGELGDREVQTVMQPEHQSFRKALPSRVI